jgi:predicted GNAT family acetyltransferase
MPTERPALHVRDVPDRQRFEASLGEDGRLAAILEYHLGPRWISLDHTEVLEGFEGQGLGSRFVRSVLDDLRRRELLVVPRCPFVVTWLKRHPEQHDILYGALETPDPDEPSSA